MAWSGRRDSPDQIRWEVQGRAVRSRSHRLHPETRSRRVPSPSRAATEMFRVEHNVMTVMPEQNRADR